MEVSGRAACAVVSDMVVGIGGQRLFISIEIAFDRFQVLAVGVPFEADFGVGVRLVGGLRQADILKLALSGSRLIVFPPGGAEIVGRSDWQAIECIVAGFAVLGERGLDRGDPALAADDSVTRCDGRRSDCGRNDRRRQLDRIAVVTAAVGGVVVVLFGVVGRIGGADAIVLAHRGEAHRRVTERVAERQIGRPDHFQGEGPAIGGLGGDGGGALRSRDAGNKQFAGGGVLIGVSEATHVGLPVEIGVIVIVEGGGSVERVGDRLDPAHRSGIFR